MHYMYTYLRKGLVSVVMYRYVGKIIFRKFTMLYITTIFDF